MLCKRPESFAFRYFWRLSPSTSVVRLTNGVPKWYCKYDGILSVLEYSFRLILLSSDSRDTPMSYLLSIAVLERYKYFFWCLRDSCMCYCTSQWIAVCSKSLYRGNKRKHWRSITWRHHVVVLSGVRSFVAFQIQSPLHFLCRPSLHTFHDLSVTSTTFSLFIVCPFSHAWFGHFADMPTPDEKRPRVHAVRSCR